MKLVIHQNELYNSETGADEAAAIAVRRLGQIEELIKQNGDRPQRGRSETDRNLFTRTVDAGISAARRFAPPLHWLGAAILAAGLFIYAWLLALTVRLTTTGERRWPDLPVPCVLTIRRLARFRKLPNPNPTSLKVGWQEEDIILQFH
jgi:hypothetical protein